MVLFQIKMPDLLDAQRHTYAKEQQEQTWQNQGIHVKDIAYCSTASGP
jgi:hypothetical protein